MAEYGYLTVHAYTSNAEIPLKDVSIAVTAADGTAIALRLTDRSGRIDPIPIAVPDKSESQTPQDEEEPYTNVNIYARLELFEQVSAENLQIFAGTTTNQDLEMIPLPEFPQLWNQKVVYNTTPQDL